MAAIQQQTVGTQTTSVQLHIEQNCQLRISKYVSLSLRTVGLGTMMQSHLQMIGCHALRLIPLALDAGHLRPHHCDQGLPSRQ